MAESIDVKSKFTFRYLQGHEFNFLTNRNIKELLQKWLAISFLYYMYTCRLHLAITKIEKTMHR